MESSFLTDESPAARGRKSYELGNRFNPYLKELHPVEWQEWQDAWYAAMIEDPNWFYV